MDFTTIIEHAATAVVAGVGSLITTLRSTDGKFKKLEENMLRSTDVNAWKGDVIKGLQLEWDSLKLEVEKTVLQLERSSNPAALLMEPILDRILAPLIRRLEKLESNAKDADDTLREKSFISRLEYNEFLKEQHAQWTEINRTIGELRGELQSRKQRP